MTLQGLEIMFLLIALLSDSYASYRSLRYNYGFRHLMVNHSKNFVDPTPRNIKVGTRFYRNIKVHT